MKRLLAITLLACAVAGAQPAATSQGSMSLNLSIADDNGIDAVTEIIALKNIRASEIEPFIRARLSRYGAVQVNDALNMLILTDKKPKVNDLAALVRKLDVAGYTNFLRLETEAIPVQYVQPSIIRPYLAKQISPEGTIDANDDLNLLIVTDVRSKINSIKQLAGQLDLLPKQVMVTLRIYDISATNTEKYGLDLFDIAAKSLPEQLYLSANGSGTKYDQLQRQTSSGSQTDYDYNYRNRNWSGNASATMSPTSLLQAIEQAARKGDATLVASPSVLVQNRRNGQLYTELVYRDRNGYVMSRVDGLVVSVTPSITNSDIVGMQVTMSFNGANDNNSRLTNSVTVSNGQPLVIGKMSTKMLRHSRKGLPLLKDVPVLGYLFGKKEISEESRSLLIIATPFIYGSGQGISDTTNTLK
jgi:type II secretory pathway component GspD/PulD (secretin)